MISRLALSLLLVFSLLFRVANAEAQEARVPEPAAQPVQVQADAGSDAPASHGLALPDAPTEFRTFDGGWIQMAYHPSLAARVRVLQEQAEEVKSQLSTLLGRPVLEDVHVRVGRTAGEMETLAPQGTGFPKYAAGVAYSELGLVLLTAESRHPGARHDLPEVFRHELAHIALHDAVGRDNVPRWFNEGFAIHASGEEETSRMQALWTATVSDNLLPFSSITNSFPQDAQAASVAYAQAADLLRFLQRTGEEHRFEALIHRLNRGQEFNEALTDAYQTDMYSLEKSWREDVARRYTFWPILFGGSLIWVFAFGLMIGGYLRRKRRADLKLARWAREEALEDKRREQFARGVLSAGVNVDAARRTAQLVLREGVSVRDREGGATPGHDGSRFGVVLHSVPSVEHDGERHTLH